MGSARTAGDSDRKRIRAQLMLGLMFLAGAWIWLQSADSTARGAHVAACPGGGAVDLQFGPGLKSAAHVSDVVVGWYTYSQEVVAGPQAEPAGDIAECVPLQRVRTREGQGNLQIGLDIAKHWVLADALLFVPAYCLLLWAMLRYLATNPGFEDRDPPLLWLAQRAARRKLWIPLVAVGAVADWVENWQMARSLDQWWTSLATTKTLHLDAGDLFWIRAAGAVKWAALIGPIVLALCAAAYILWRILGEVRRSFGALWVQLVCAVVFVVLISLAQGSDALRRLSVRQWLITVLVLALFALVVALTASGVLLPRKIRERIEPPADAGWWEHLGPAALTALFGVLLIGAAWLFGVKGLGALGVIEIVIGVVSGVLDWAAWRGKVSTERLGSAPQRADRRPEVARVAAGLAGIVIGGFGLMTVRATVPGLVILHDGFNNWWRAAAGMTLTALAVPAVFAARWAIHRARAVPDRTQATVLFGLAGVIVVIGFLLYHRGAVQRVAPTMGTLNVVAVFLSSFCILGALAAHATNFARRWRNGDRLAIPTALRLAGYQRHHSPIIGVAVLWAVAATSVNYTGYYAIREIRDADARPALLTPSVAVEKWVARQQPGRRPLVMVASSGGGVRAAYWTALVMTCVIEMDTTGSDPCGSPAPPDIVAARRRALFAMSGASGGSLGLAEYVAQVGSDWSSSPPTPLDPSWVDHSLGHDFLSPTLATFLFRDMLAALLRPQSGHDRAESLEVAWERASDGAMAAPFFSSQQAGEQPFLMMNGTNVSDGCRVLTSAVATQVAADAVMCNRGTTPGAQPDAAESTIDLGNQLCPTCDVSFATAALNSARFPLVTPAGRVPGIDGSSNVDVVDGGYRENSGSSTLVDLWPEFEAAVASADTSISPIFVQIDNGYSVEQLRSIGNVNLNQLVVPVKALLALQSGTEKAARQRSLHLFDSGCGSTTYFHLTTMPHPGISAPLGWVLSKEAAADLHAQLGINLRAIIQLRRAIDIGHAGDGCVPSPAA